ncbi:MAG TPA: PIN domain-containing protein [Lacipirellulaceae bacterium]|nr:PIN domain-containing protein [Lacipirellulaceae bacterium]
MSVFLDTVGLIALLNEDDQWHSQAVDALGTIEEAGRSFITTSYVLLETGNAVARTRLRERVTDVMSEMTTSGRLVIPTSDDWEEGWRHYSQSYANRAGIVDCVSFVVMRRKGLTEAFSNDEHFRAAGFRTLF